MWRRIMPFRKQVRAKQTPIRRSRWYRPRLEYLEDRCLLSVSLTGPTSALVGAPGAWTAAATGDGTSPVYQFSVTPQGGATQIIKDYSTTNTFIWNTLQEGNYQISVNVEDSFGAPVSDSISVSYTATTRITGSSAVVSSTSNPLIALFSAPPTSGNSMYVQFSPQSSNPVWRNTPSESIVPGESTNFLVAGMLPNTTYLMRYVVDNGTPSSSLTFTTGSLPTNLTFPAMSVLQGPTSATDMTQDMIFHQGINITPGVVDLLATDLAGNVDWYYDPVANNYAGYAPDLEPGGTIFMLGGQTYGNTWGFNTLRQLDLLGDPLRETNINAINAQLAAMGKDPIFDFSHEAILLPNGNTAVIAGTQRVININGTPTTYTSDDVLVLDQNFQVKWVWDALDWLDPNRLPTNGEGPSDFTHANTIAWSPKDGNLLVSLRAQDWVVKINYDHGQGDGHIIWRLGAGGDFTLNSSDPTAWFSHQHDTRYINDNTVLVYDNGNTRHQTNPYANSRGQEWILNEQTMTATPVVNADLGVYASAVGSNEALPNGNLAFTAGDLGSSPSYYGQSIEVTPDGAKNYAMQMNELEYRSYFMNTLYNGTVDTYGLSDSGFEDPSQGTGASAYQYDPTGSAWSYSGMAGVAGNGSAITSSNPNAPEGSQVAFLQGTGTISQVVNFLTAGNYQLSFSAAQQANNTGNEEIQVQVDGTVAATCTPTSTSYSPFTTSSFNVTAGRHTITFVGVTPPGTNYTALLDQVGLSTVQTPGQATFVNTDTSTEGSWQGVYGNQGYSVIDNATSYPSYAQVSASGNSNNLTTNSTTDPRALQEVGSSYRIVACWYSPTSFTVNVSLTDGQTHQLALYLLDWIRSNRNEQVQILDAATGNVLSTETASNFGNGEYLIWNVSGNIQIKITNLNSTGNAVLNGLFFDPAATSPPPPSATATFVNTDTTTEGSWQGVYGNQGYSVIDNATSYPSYAQVSASGNSNNLNTTTATDPRALQEVGSSYRIVACWYSPTSFTVNVSLTDGQTHQLALYLLDWIRSNRNEQVQILDAATGNVLSTETASNFGNGEYLVWNVSGNIQIKITNLNSTGNAVLNGLFFDPAATSPPPSPSSIASFVKTDTTTQGNRQNVYGNQGSNAMVDATNSLNHAPVSAGVTSNNLTTNSTTDLTDRQMQPLALYLLDWIRSNRNEQVQMLAAMTGNVLSTETASNFGNGEYLIWNVSDDIQI